ncbi:MAG TPA: hypothetical protein DCZ12_12155 [Gammaproteobacteria bacterium]|nr:hypothetical protein [Gammaproteobacteria bacterium]
MKDERQQDAQASEIERIVIAPEVLDVVRFLAETWSEIDKFVYQNCDGESLMRYPVVQGTRNQMNLKKIASQGYDPAKLKAGVEWLLAQ